MGQMIPPDTDGSALLFSLLVLESIDCARRLLSVFGFVILPEIGNTSFSTVPYDCLQAMAASAYGAFPRRCF